MRYRRQEMNEPPKTDENILNPKPTTISPSSSLNSLSIDSTTSKRSGVMSRIHRNNNALLIALPMNQLGSFDMSSKNSLE